MSESVPATYGGDGWAARTSSHLEDVTAGRVWRRCGVRSEVAELVEVLLARPLETMFTAEAPNDLLLLEWPAPDRLQTQAEGIATLYRSHGVAVSWAEGDASTPINFLFQRDLFFMTPEGAVLARPAPPQRAGEARHAALALAKAGVPILATPRAHALFEGADALWLDGNTVLVGVGRRTNEAGAAFLAAVLEEMHIDVVTVAMPERAQHLLGVVNFVDHDLAMVRAGKASDELSSILKVASVDVLTADDAMRSAADAVGMNFVTLGPRRVAMPSGYPSIRDRLRDAGTLVSEIDVSEYCKAAGGLACSTGILQRRV